MSAVLEDAVDQMAILGRIMPVSFEENPNANEIVGDDIARLVGGQRKLEDRFENVLAQKNDLQGQGRVIAEQRASLQKEGVAAAADLKNSTHVFARSLKQSPLTPDNLEKVQADRHFLEKVLHGTLLEVSQTGNYQTLIDAVRTEKEKKKKLQETIQKEGEGVKRVKFLQRQLIEVRKEKEQELQQRHELIAHFKDQLQETKAKTNMEGKYIQKSCQVAVSQTQKRCTMNEKEMKEEIERLRHKIDEEIRVNAEIENYLKTHQTELEQKVDYWMEKYDKDVEAKQHELDVLNASKAKDLDRLNELIKLYSEYENVVLEDRIEKEKARRKAEQEAEELKAAVSIQAWFRGVMVRRGLGPYGKKGKGKKGKKGKKSGKKKKK